MNDDLVEIARDSYGGPTYMDTTLPEPRFLIHVLADEIARLRAELVIAQEYRDALNEALASRAWMNPIQDDETPKDALDRLLRFEVAANLDPETSEHVADLVHAARRDGMEEAAQLVETHVYTVSNFEPQFRLTPDSRAKDDMHHTTIAAAIRAAAGEVKP